ncbi:CotD family spore coat protein [Actinomycetes bacterium NPDC127524]
MSFFNRNSGANKPFKGAPYGPGPMGPQAVSPAEYGPGPMMPGPMSPGGMGAGPMGPQAVSPAGYGPGPMGPQAVSPANIGPTNVQPPMVSPTQNFVNTNVSKTIVPHIHPSHTTTVNKHLFQHQHYFPHTASVVNECYNQHMICGNPCPPPRPFGC